MKTNEKTVAATLESQNDGTHVLVGSLTFETAAKAVDLSPLKSGDRNCTVDLSGVGAIDSAGLAVLIEWLAQAARFDCDLRFSHVPNRLGQLAEIAGVGKHFENN